jgi:Putative Ig domain
MLRLTSVHRIFIAPCVAMLLIAAPATAVTVDEARSKGLAWLALQQQGDGGFKSVFGIPIQTSAAALDAMRVGGLSKSPQFNRTVGWLSNAPASSIDARSWQIQSLAGAGLRTEAMAAAVRDTRNLANVTSAGILDAGGATWGPFAGYAASSADTALAFGALRSGGLRYTGDDSELVVSLLCFLLPSQKTAGPWAGSWSYALALNQQPTAVSSGSILATALLTFELKKLMQSGRANGYTVCGRSIPGDVNTASLTAKNWLLNQRNSDNGFAERNLQTGALEQSNIVLTSLVIRALQVFAAEGDVASANAVSLAQVWLANQQNIDGNWRGDAFVTARAIAALPSAAGAQALDTDKDGLTDVVEQRLGTNITTADSQNKLQPSANSQLGLTAAAFSVNGRLNEAFNYSIPAQGGTAPFTFSRKAGVLPQGLSISSTGVISGMPLQTGTFSFDYEVRDSAGTTALIVGRVEIDEATQQVANDGDVPIPAWALVLLGGGLLAAMKKRGQK